MKILWEAEINGVKGCCWNDIKSEDRLFIFYNTLCLELITLSKTTRICQILATYSPESFLKFKLSSSVYKLLPSPSLPAFYRIRLHKLTNIKDAKLCFSSLSVLMFIALLSLSYDNSGSLLGVPYLHLWHAFLEILLFKRPKFRIQHQRKQTNKQTKNKQTKQAC